MQCYSLLQKCAMHGYYVPFAQLYYHENVHVFSNITLNIIHPLLVQIELIMHYAPLATK